VATLYDRALMPAALLGAGLAAFLIVGLAGLPLLTRYLLIPAVMLALFCGFAAFGWFHIAKRTPLQRLWVVGSLAMGIALALSIPATVRELRQARSLVEARRAIQSDLNDLTKPASARRWLQDCPEIRVSSTRAVPLLAFWLQRPPNAIMPLRAKMPARGALVIARSDDTYRQFALDPGDLHRARPPRGFRRIGANESWALYVRC
jgi:hypothetical protein